MVLDTHSAVLDNTLIQALLRLGFRDGLLKLKPGVHLPFITEERNELLERQVLEQLVLTPHVMGFFDRGHLAEDVLDGPLFDAPWLTRAQTPKLNWQFGHL